MLCTSYEEYMNVQICSSVQWKTITNYTLRQKLVNMFFKFHFLLYHMSTGQDKMKTAPCLDNVLVVKI